jgi:hypothetical protein
VAWGETFSWPGRKLDSPTRLVGCASKVPIREAWTRNTATAQANGVVGGHRPLTVDRQPCEGREHLCMLKMGFAVGPKLPTKEEGDG